MKVILISILLVALALSVIAIKVLFKKNGRFSGTCSGNNGFQKDGTSGCTCGANSEKKCQSSQKTIVL